MKINKEELHKLYMEWVDEVAEECDWKTTFGPEEIVEAIATILEKNPYKFILTDESVNNDYMEYSIENTLNQIRLNEKKVKMLKEHPLTNTLINLKDFMEDLSNYDAPESSDGWSLSNLPHHFWETLGECINDIEDYIKNNYK
jgi:hypothetical protein